MSDSTDLLFAIDEELAATSQVEEGTAYGCDLSFDWGTLQFRLVGGSPLVIDGQRTILESAVKALLTPRFEVPIYTDDYGSELTTLIGKDRALALALIPQMVSEAVLEDDRIESAEISDVYPDGSVVYVRHRLRDFTGAIVQVPALTVHLGT